MLQWDDFPELIFVHPMVIDPIYFISIFARLLLPYQVNVVIMGRFIRNPLFTGIGQYWWEYFYFYSLLLVRYEYLTCLLFWPSDALLCSIWQSSLKKQKKADLFMVPVKETLLRNLNALPLYGINMSFCIFEFYYIFLASNIQLTTLSFFQVQIWKRFLEQSWIWKSTR